MSYYSASFCVKWHWETGNLIFWNLIVWLVFREHLLNFFSWSVCYIVIKRRIFLVTQVMPDADMIYCLPHFVDKNHYTLYEAGKFDSLFSFHCFWELYVEFSGFYFFLFFLLRFSGALGSLEISCWLGSILTRLSGISICYGVWFAYCAPLVQLKYHATPCLPTNMYWKDNNSVERLGNKKLGL